MGGMTNDKKLIELAVNTIRMLAVDGTQKANSGHPGMPMGMADCAYVLWTAFLKYNPEDPEWPNRDRFILSAGHGSMLLYSMLHLAGYDVSLEDLKQFRQWNSPTAGHPEYGHIAGVETTTGPLGQGFANGVGMALASKMMADKFNTNEAIIDHHVYAIVSDGDLMEGVASEAASIAGHLKLGNLIYLYDDNQITIEGNTSLAFSENVAKRFEAYGWHTLSIDGHNHDEIADAIQKGIDENQRPTLILAKTHIGFGSPNKQDTAGVHGSPLGEDEVAQTKKNLGWPLEPTFLVPDEVRALFAERAEALANDYNSWNALFKKWQDNNRPLYTTWKAIHEKDVPDDLEEQLAVVIPDKPTATRVIGGKVLNKAAELMAGLCGGSADLAPSTKTMIENEPSVVAGQYGGRNLHFGIREHGMGGIMNGMALYGGLIPYGSTFLVFADYVRPSVRLSALMGVQAIYIFTHDSIFVGEDGPTHQPVEHVASLRAIPNLHVSRPADGLETAAAYAQAIRRKDGPTAFCLTRQNLPVLEREEGFKIRNIQKGGYILSREKGGRPDVVLIGTGSEVSVAVEAKSILEQKGYDVRVVSMPCLDAFQEQGESYIRQIIPDDIPVVVVEAGIAQGWSALTRAPFLMIGMNRFGASAPAKILAEKFGLTGSSAAEKVEAWLKK